MEIRNYIEEAGFDSGRIRFQQLSSNMSWYLKEIIGRFVGELQGMSIPKSEIEIRTWTESI